MAGVTYSTRVRGARSVSGYPLKNGDFNFLSFHTQFMHNEIDKELESSLVCCRVKPASLAPQQACVD